MNYNLGRILPIYRGTYEVGTTYNKLDIVYVSGYGSYVAKQTVASVQPQDNPEIWQLVAADCTNEELVETFNANEAEREQRVNNFILSKSQELSTLINEVNNEVNSKLSEVDSEMQSINSEWDSMKNTMNNQFNSAQEERENIFTANEQQRENTLNTAITNIENSDTAFKNSLQNETSEWLNEREVEFNEAQTERATEFNTSMTSMNGQFNAAQANRTTTFNNSESDRATTFTTNETARQNTFETNEDARQDEFDSKEAARDEATQAIINEHDYLLALDNTKANKDGYYSTLTAGAAENLVGDSVDSETYLIRPTGGENNEVANGVASVFGMEGNSAVWNQMLNKPQGGTVSGPKGYTTTIVGQVPILAIVGHKYYLSVNIDRQVTSTNTINIRFGGSTIASSGGLSIPVDTDTPNNTIVSAVRECTSVPNSSQIYYHNGTSNGGLVEGDYITIKNPMMIDLTLLGIDNITTASQVEEWLAQYVGTKPYYAYNEGTILSAKTLGMKTYGQNLLNPTTRQAKLIPYTWEENSNVYTIKNVLSGATATFTPDNTGVAETVDVSGGSFDITNYGIGTLELSNAISNTYVCMKWDSTKDDDVVPYEDHTYNFDVTKVYGKLNGEGEYMQCFPNGMSRYDTVADTLVAEKAVNKFNKVILSDLTWTKDNATGFSNLFFAELPITARYRGSGSANNNTSYQITNKGGYVKAGYYALTDGNTSYPKIIVAGKSSKQGGDSFSKKVYIKDTSCSTVGQLMTNIQGIEFLYETTNSMLDYNNTTYIDLIYSEDEGATGTPFADVLMNITVNNWSMEEQWITPYENGNPTSIPATINTQYSMDAVNAIDTLQKNTYTETDIYNNISALLSSINTNCGTVLGGTFSVSDTATDKVFTFTFTPNEEGGNQ